MLGAAVCVVVLGALTAAAAGGQKHRIKLESIHVVPPGGEIEALVRRHLPLRIGQTVTSDILVQAREHLSATGLFADLEVYTRRGSSVGAVELVVEAALAKRIRIEAGLGHEPLRGWYLNIVGLRVTSPFHRGGMVRAGFRNGQRMTGFFTDLEVPLEGHHDLELLGRFLSVGQHWEIHDADRAYVQIIHRVQSLAGLRRHFPNKLSVTLWAGYSMADPGHKLYGVEDNPDEAAGRLVPTPDGAEHYLEQRLEILLDHRDHLRPWQAGHWMGWRLHTSQPIDGGPFWGSDFDIRRAFPVAGTRAAAFRIHGAYAGPGTPYHQRLIVGGVRSLRGFASAGLSGPLGARALWLASGEWRQPLAGSNPRRPSVIGTLFVDVGDHWDVEDRRHGFSADVGYGLLLRIPWLHTLNLEVAYPLTEDLTGNPVALQACFGRSF